MNKKERDNYLHGIFERLKERNQHQYDSRIIREIDSIGNNEEVEGYLLKFMKSSPLFHCTAMQSYLKHFLFELTPLGYKFLLSNKKYSSFMFWRLERISGLFDFISKPTALIISILTIAWNIYTSKTNEATQTQLKQTIDSAKQVLTDLDLKYTVNIEKTEQLRKAIETQAKNDTTASKLKQVK